MRTTSLSRAARHRWMAMWRKAMTVWWTMAKAAMASSMRTALSSDSTRWKRTKMRQRATRALRPLRLSSTLWRSTVAANGGTPYTNTHTQTHIWIYKCMRRNRACLETVGFPLQKEYENTGVELNHDPSFYVSSSEKLAHGGDIWRKWTVLVFRCTLPALYPHRLKVCLWGSSRHLEASTSREFPLVYFCSKYFQWALLANTPLIPLCGSLIWYTLSVSNWGANVPNTQSQMHTHTDTLAPSCNISASNHRYQQDSSRYVYHIDIYAMKDFVFPQLVDESLNLNKCCIQSWHRFSALQNYALSPYHFGLNWVSKNTHFGLLCVFVSPLVRSNHMLLFTLPCMQWWKWLSHF